MPNDPNWPDICAAGAAGQGRAVVANDEFFQRKQAAAVLKHGVLSRYLTVFASMTGSASAGGRVHFIDGYAGPGRYEPEYGQAVGSAGSPLLASETATRLSSAKWDSALARLSDNRFIAANLSAVLGAEWRGGGSYDVKEGEVESHLEAAVSAAGKDPLLIFLDPFGTALAYDLLVQTLAGRPKGAPTEVLLNFNIDSVRRIGGRLSEDLTPGTSKFNSRELTLRRVDGFLSGEWWRQMYLDNYTHGEDGSAGRAATLVADEFRRRLEAATGLKSIVVPVRRRPGHAPLFLLTLFYGHDAAAYQFADVASLANKDWRNYNRQLDLAEEIERFNTAPTLFAVDEMIAAEAKKDADAAEKRLHTAWIDRVAANIRELMRTRSAVPLAAVAEVYGDAFGVEGRSTFGRLGTALPRRAWSEPRDKRNKRMWSQSIVRATP